jgi:hypothetical protein
MGVEGMQEKARKSVRQNIHKNCTRFSRGYSTSRSSQQLKRGERGIVFNIVESKRMVGIVSAGVLSQAMLATQEASSLLPEECYI